jgi:xanthine dehydrogenase accessory factor
MNSAPEFGALIVALRELRLRGRTDAAMATLTRKRGSTFRRPGTRMLVFADGSVVCELSGGCPQRDIVLRAQDVIACGEPSVVSYNAESGLDVLMEMGCGGELEVLIEPLAAPRSTDFVEVLVQCLDQRCSVRLATLFAIDDAVVMPQRMIWCEGRVRYHDFDDPVLAQSVLLGIERSDASAPFEAGTRRISCAQGEVDVLVESIVPPHRLAVIGSGAAARALLPLAAALGWEATLVDHDPQRLPAEGLPPTVRTLCASPATIGDVLPLDAHSSAVVMTHNLEQDMDYLAALGAMPLAYLGALGSRERVGRMRDNALLADIAMHAPAGLDIGSETPEEIALAIAAEIMAVINGRNGGPLHDNEGTIH